MSFNIRQLPFIGGTIYKTGQVLDILGNPCSPEPSVMVQAAFSYTPRLLWSLFKPSPVDYLTDRFGQTHHRKRKQRWRIGIMDVTPPPGAGKVTVAAFKGLALQQRVGWYFLVADATADFALNWTSMAYQYSGCDVIGAPHASGKRITTIEMPSGAGDYPIGPFTTTSSHIWIASTAGCAKNTIGPWTASYAVEVSESSLGPPYAEMTNSGVHGPGDGGFKQTTHSINDAGTGIKAGVGIVRQYDVDAATGNIFPFLTKTSGHLKIRSSWFEASGTLDNGIRPDP